MNPSISDQCEFKGEFHYRVQTSPPQIHVNITLEPHTRIKWKFHHVWTLWKYSQLFLTEDSVIVMNQRSKHSWSISLHKKENYSK